MGLVAHFGGSAKRPAALRSNGLSPAQYLPCHPISERGGQSSIVFGKCIAVHVKSPADAGTMLALPLVVGGRQFRVGCGPN